jgi:hypothetical protein
MIGLDAGGCPAERAPPVGTDRKLGRDGAAVFERYGYAGVAGFDSAGFVLDPNERGKFPRSGIERGQQVPVLDIIAEGVEPDFGRGEADLRCANKAGGRVDDTHDPERRRMGLAGRPDAERLQRGHGTGQQRGGAVVGTGPGGDEGCLDAGFGERERRRQPRRAATHDRHFHG